MRFGVCIGADMHRLAKLREYGYNARISLEGAFGDDWNDTVQKMRTVLKVFE